MDNLADLVQSLFYHNVNFNVTNMQIYKEMECKIPKGEVSKQTFKVDMGADGNLMPFTIFAKLFPKISLKLLKKTVEKGVNLFAYNNTPIRQFGVCSIYLSIKGKSEICKFYVVKHTTAILGISNSERLCLVRVNFDMVDHSVKKFMMLHLTHLNVRYSQNFQNCSKELGA